MQTYPAPGQMLTRPNLKLKKHSAEKELSSSIPDLTGKAVGGIDSLHSDPPPSPCTQASLGPASSHASPFQRSTQHYVKRVQNVPHGKFICFGALVIVPLFFILSCFNM